jgi:hypothetical protein
MHPANPMLSPMAAFLARQAAALALPVEAPLSAEEEDERQAYHAEEALGMMEADLEAAEIFHS